MFSSQLYRAYCRLNHYGTKLNERISPAGWSLAAAGVVFFFFGLDTTRSTTYQMLAVVFSLLIITWLLTPPFRHKVAAKRVLPRFTTAGKPFRYEIQLTNHGKRRLRHLRVYERRPPAIPAKEEFLHTPEPDEHRRNPFDRTFIYYRWTWLGERHRTHSQACSEYFDLMPGESKTITMEMLPLRRGYLRLPPVTLMREDPIGLFRRTKPCTGPANTIPILPSPIPVTLPSQNQTARHQHGGELPQPKNRSGLSDEFLSLRDYRPGDPKQHIHWRSFARFDRPIIREFETTNQPRHALFLDTILPREGAAQLHTYAFEQAVNLAAGTLLSRRQEGSQVDLLFIQNRAHQFSSGPNQSNDPRLVHLLAGIHATTNGNVDALQPIARAQGHTLSDCFAILLQWDQSRADLLKEWQMHNVNIIALLIHPRKYPPQQAPPPWVHCLVAEDLPANLPVELRSAPGTFRAA